MLQLLDAGSNVLASSLNPDNWSERITAIVAPGSYYARVVPYTGHHTTYHFTATVVQPNEESRVPTELFADRIAEIAVTGAVVRLDFASFSVTARDAGNQPTLEHRQRVVMPTEGFVQSFALMAKVMQDLEKRGLVRRAEPTADPAAGGAAAPAPVSPNFG